MVQLSATRCSCIAILWVILVSFAAITLCVASQRVFIVVSVYFVIDSVRKLLDTPSYASLPSRIKSPANPKQRILLDNWDNHFEGPSQGPAGLPIQQNADILHIPSRIRICYTVWDVLDRIGPYRHCERTKRALLHLLRVNRPTPIQVPTNTPRADGQR
jgi:hypothetical protein